MLRRSSDPPAKILAPPFFCRNFSGTCCCIDLKDFAGDSRGEFIWALFPTIMRRKNLATRFEKRSSGSKRKICGKSVLPETDPKNVTGKAAFALGGNILTILTLKAPWGKYSEDT